MRVLSLLLLSALLFSCANEGAEGGANDPADTATVDSAAVVDTVRRPATEGSIEPRTNGEF